MKFIQLITALLFCTHTFSQQEVDVITGASYLFEVYYNMETGSIKTTNRIEWDIAFNTNPTSATILANNGKELKVYVYPLGDTANWMNIDTNGINHWQPLYNSLNSWDIGAFNQNKSNKNDFGWGTYHSENNTIEGDSLYILTYTTGEHKVLWIEHKNLSTNKWKIHYANINGTDETTTEINANEFTSKHLIHYSLLNHLTLSHEPNKKEWDLYFNVFWDYNIPFKLNGVWQNRHIAVEQVENVDQETFENFDTTAFSTTPSTIGGDWKYYNWQMVQYELSDTTVFFIKDTLQPWSSPLYKIYFTYFGGMGNGIYRFMQEKIQPTGITPFQTSTASVYPSPAKKHINIIHDLKGTGTIQTFNSSGTLVNTLKINNKLHLNKEILNISAFTPGVYYCIINTEFGRAKAQFIKIE